MSRHDVMAGGVTSGGVAAGDVASDGVTVVGFVLDGQKSYTRKVTYIFTNVMFTQ